MSRLSRRSLLKATAASSLFPLFTVAGTKASAKVVGANERIRVGIVGINGRGGSHISEFGKASQTEIACLVDVDANLYKSRIESVKKASGSDKAPNCVKDVREALDDKSLDVISIATPNHWHSLMTIWACQAGKDVYVEKPISHNLFEGRKCIEAAKKYNRVVQHGTQNRSREDKAREIAAVHSEKYGKLLVSKGYCCKPRWSIGFKPIETPPESLDFNLWLGPAPDQPFHRNLVHYNWHWFWDTGNGDIGNQGVHEIDIARWAIKGATLPNKVWSAGGRYVPDGPDQGQTPNMQLAVMEFGDVLLVFETRGLVGKDPKFPNRVANEYYTTDGVIRDGKFYKKDSAEGEPVQVEDKDKISVIPGGAFPSFLKCVRERIFETNCNAEVAHYSAALCHLANAAYRVGQAGTLEQAKAALPKGPQVAEAFEKINANCTAVDLPIKGSNLTIGKSLAFDAAKEKFVDDEAANRLLTRVYRPPFVVPDSV